ncbi:ABC transporter ATP-binding protein [Jatrophihabitans sp. YIM 134969]
MTHAAVDPSPVRARGLAVSARRLVHIYRVEGNDVVALTSVDLEVAPGQVVALLGPSGSGKSTLLTLLAGLHRPSAGALVVGDVDLARADEAARDRLRATEVGVLLQGAGRNLLPYATPVQNVERAQAVARRLGRSLPSPHEMLDLVGVADLADARLATLPPGLVQVVAVAVATSALPGLLLADEPTSQLDHAHRDDVLAAIKAVNEAVGTTVLLVTHDLEVANRLPRQVTIRDGRIGAEGLGAAELAVVGGDGTVQLPPDIASEFPPGSLLRVRRLPGGEIVLESTVDTPSEEPS